MLRVASRDTDCHFLIGQSLLTSLRTFFGSLAFELTHRRRHRMHKLNPKVDNLSNFQPIAGNSKGNSSDRKLINFWGGKNVNETYIFGKC